MHVYVLNMPRQTGRRKEMELALKENQFPPDRTHIWSKYEECSTQYAKCSSLMRAAVADGFPGFQKWVRDTTKYQNIGVIGHTWSLFRIWRETEKKTGFPIMFLHDDWLPTQPYDFYVRLTESAEKDSNGAWKLICLQGREDFFSFKYGKERNREYIDGSKTLLRGISRCCGDVGYIITQRGIEWIQNHFEKQFWYIEELFKAYCEEPNTYTVSEECLRCIQPEYPSTIHKAGKDLYPEKAG